jgi:hypothetical protein
MQYQTFLIKELKKNRKEALCKFSKPIKSQDLQGFKNLEGLFIEYTFSLLI